MSCVIKSITYTLLTKYVRLKLHNICFLFARWKNCKLADAHFGLAIVDSFFDINIEDTFARCK